MMKISGLYQLDLHIEILCIKKGHCTSTMIKEKIYKVFPAPSEHAKTMFNIVQWTYTGVCNVIADSEGAYS